METIHLDHLGYRLIDDDRIWDEEYLSCSKIPIDHFRQLNSRKGLSDITVTAEEGRLVLAGWRPMSEHEKEMVENAKKRQDEQQT